MNEHVHIVIESGEDKGREISVPAQGARMGRSSRNDVTLSDPLLSRHHCRVFFKADADMWIADLGSANRTFVNGKPIEESLLHTGDSIAVGDTVMKVVSDRPLPESVASDAKGAPIVDLGLNAAAPPRTPSKKSMRERLIVLLIALAALAVAGGLWKHFEQQADEIQRPVVAPTGQLPQTLEIDYEKVEASPENIFRYKLTLDRQGMLTVQVDDIMNERRLLEETRLDERKIAGLIRDIHDTAFFTLKEDYVGFQPNILNLWDLAMTLDNRTHRSVVRNRPEPDSFKALREKIEVFGKTELGLWAMQFPREKLIQMAEDAFERAQRLYHQRDVKNENLHEAIVSLKQAHMDLRSVEPKPDFYAESLALLSDCTTLLQEKFTEHNFRASRAVNLGQWEEAAEQLRVILELIPDKNDSRYRDTRTLLLEVENRQRGRR